MLWDVYLQATCKLLTSFITLVPKVRKPRSGCVTANKNNYELKTTVNARFAYSVAEIPMTSRDHPDRGGGSETGDKVKENGNRVTTYWF